MNLFISSTRKLAAELIALTVAFAFAGFFLAPACWTANAKNPNFTGWCVSLAKLLEGGGKLYADGTHLPLSPLPFVLLHKLVPSGKIWLGESLANFACLWLTILIMHVVLSRLFRGPVPMIASCIASVWFFCCKNNLLYNTLPQVFVAAMCLTALHLATSGRGMMWAHFLALCVLTALCILSKQSTGIGAALGVCAWLLCAGVQDCQSRAADFCFRLLTIALFLAGTAAVTWGVVRLLSASVDPSGFFHDVLLHGSDTKGGSHYIVRLLFRGSQTVFAGLWFVLVFCLMLAGLGRRHSFWTMLPGGKSNEADARRRKFPFPRMAKLSVAVGVLWGLTYVILYCLPQGRVVGLLERAQFLAGCVVDTSVFSTECGLVLALGLAACMVVKMISPGNHDAGETKGRRAFIGVTLIALMALFFHSLSDSSLTNFLGDQAFQPMVILAAAVFISLAIAALEVLEEWRLSPALKHFLAAALFGWIVGMAAVRFCAIVSPLAECKITVADVPYLRGAKLAPNATGVLQLAARVRALVGANETVLLLPGDPNLESWFDRKRPALSCPIIFSDQYWADYVERDFQKLNSDPPNAIIIGPRNEMRSAYQWSPGARRLISRIQMEILPKRYQLAFSQPFIHQDQEDFFDVYVLSENVK